MKIGNTIYVVGYLMLMIIIPDSITHCSSQMLIQAAPYQVEHVRARKRTTGRKV